MNVSILREPDDNLVNTRISIGKMLPLGMYITFRGEPEDVVAVLEEALAVVRVALPRGIYADHRERPQG